MAEKEEPMPSTRANRRCARKRSRAARRARAHRTSQITMAIREPEAFKRLVEATPLAIPHWSGTGPPGTVCGQCRSYGYGTQKLTVAIDTWWSTVSTAHRFRSQHRHVYASSHETRARDRSRLATLPIQNCGASGEKFDDKVGNWTLAKRRVETILASRDSTMERVGVENLGT